MPVHNNNVGVIADDDVTIKGAQASESTTLKGSIFGLRAVKDLTSGIVTPANVDSQSTKNWFAEYVGTLGNFNKSKFDNQNIKFSDYKGATILGFKVQTQNEVGTKYCDNNDAILKVTPINGTTTGTPFTVQVGSTIETNKGSSAITFGGFEGGGDDPAPYSGSPTAVKVTDTVTGVTITMTWIPGYGTLENSTIRGSGTMGSVNETHAFTWSTTPQDQNYSNALIFFLGKQSSRPYGLVSTYEA